MGVPSKEDIAAALRVPEVAPARHRVHIRTDVITPAQRAVKDQWKSNLSIALEQRLRRKASVKRTKWDV